MTTAERTHVASSYERARAVLASEDARDLPDSFRLTRASMLRVADDLRHLIACASEAEQKEHWFSYAERTEAQLRAAAGEKRECPRFEAPDRIVIELDLTDGRTAELTYEATMWAGTPPEPSCGWAGGPELDHLTLCRVTVGIGGVPMTEWAALVPKEADAVADEAATLFEEELRDAFAA